jgi:phage terminase Nu1 subunit (DNA packaging protein)
VAENLQSVGAVAKLCVMSERNVHDLVKRQIMPRAQRGKYDLVACVQAYIRHLREEAAGRKSENQTHDLVQERARLASEMADHQAMKNALLRSDLIAGTDVEDILVTLITTVQMRMLGVGSAVADLVARSSDPAICQAIILEHVREALQELSEADVELVSRGDPATRH